MTIKTVHAVTTAGISHFPQHLTMTAQTVALDHFLTGSVAVISGGWFLTTGIHLWYRYKPHNTAHETMWIMTAPQVHPTMSRKYDSHNP